MVKKGSNARGDLRRHADALVGDRDHHVLARRHVAVVAAISFVEIDIPSLDGQFAAIAHGVARVDRDVDDGAFELMRVGAGFPQPGGQNGLDLNMLAQRRAQEVRHVGNHPVGVDRLRRQRLLAGEGEQALGQGGGTFGGSYRRVDETPDIEFVGLHAPPHEIERADDNAKHVVEVVGDAAAELADSVHLLRLAKLGLDGLPLVYLQQQVGIGSRELRIGGVDRRDRSIGKIDDQNADAADQQEHDDGSKAEVERQRAGGDFPLRQQPLLGPLHRL